MCEIDCSTDCECVSDASLFQTKFKQVIKMNKIHKSFFRKKFAFKVHRIVLQFKHCQYSPLMYSKKSDILFSLSSFISPCTGLMINKNQSQQEKRFHEFLNFLF